MSYNPYDLVAMRINGVEINGRPIEFDTEIVDFKKLENAFGKPVRPKRLSTTCPNCGQGMIVDVNLPEPPFPTVECSCTNCYPGIAPLADPFNNPIESGRITQQELDPLLHDMSKTLEPQETSVADRLPPVEFVDHTPVVAAQESPSFDAPALSETEANEDLIEVLQRGEDQTKASEPPAETEQLEEPELPAAETKPEEPVQPEKIEKAKKPKKPAKKSEQPVEIVEPTENTPDEKSFDDTDLAEPQ